MQIVRLLVVAITTSMPFSVLDLAAEQQPKQPPSALEARYLRNECIQLGRRVLAVKFGKQEKSLVSHYNFRDNRCYAMVTERAETFKSHILYDGKSQEML